MSHPTYYLLPTEVFLSTYWLLILIICSIYFSYRFSFSSYSGNQGKKRNTSNQQTGTTNLCDFRNGRGNGRGKWQFIRAPKGTRSRLISEAGTLWNQTLCEERLVVTWSTSSIKFKKNKNTIPLGHFNSSVIPEIKPFFCLSVCLHFPATQARLCNQLCVAVTVSYSEIPETTLNLLFLMAQARQETFWSLRLTFLQVSEPFHTCLQGKVDRGHSSHENHENRLPELLWRAVSAEDAHGLCHRWGAELI